jgi:hypothetical protein
MTSSYPTLHLEGGLIAPDLIEEINQGSLFGQKVSDYGFETRSHLTDEIAAAWASARSAWENFQKRLQRKDPNVSETTLTRDFWVIPLLTLLGYELTYQPRGRTIDGDNYVISHLAGNEENDPPVHIIGFSQDLDRRSDTGRPRLAAHALVQEYLNRTESVWGLVTNGRILRLLRDSGLMRRQSYIEFDLQSMMEGEKFADFVIFYRLLHRSRFPRSGQSYEDCLLEKYHHLSVEQGGRVRDHLRDGVEEALKIFANGFLKHPKNNQLRESIQHEQLSAFTFYQDLLHLIYRFLFLMVSEERGLITDSTTYHRYYSVNRLRRFAEINPAYTNHSDLWHGIETTFRFFQEEELAPFMGVPVLNGNLFSNSANFFIQGLALTNNDLLKAIRLLSLYRENEKTPYRRINYRALDVEELGSVYESLLDFQPVFTNKDGIIQFDLQAGTERKSTGSYYTPPELVSELIKSALLPVVADRLQLAKTKVEKAQAILDITVCDPACGSGHFLLAAARALGKELARIRYDEDEPTPEHLRLSIRDCIIHCIYGVDKNPLAVELCKVALWMEGHVQGKPLTFLDHRIKCGDSLVGVFDLTVLKDGIPDDAYQPVSGDEKPIAAAYKKRNKSERNSHQLSIPFQSSPGLQQIAEADRILTELPDDTPENIRRKNELYKKSRGTDSQWWSQNTACHLWTAAFFAELTKENMNKSCIPTSDDLRRYRQNQSIDHRITGYAWKLAEKHRFFHWPLEFPQVFERGGFDVILCNPPWDMKQIDPREFFYDKDTSISNASNMASRNKMISELKQINPSLYIEYLQAVSDDDHGKKFIHNSKKFPLTEFGRLNLAPLFAENVVNLTKRIGRIGIVIPTGIATDSFNQYFFSYLVKNRHIISLYDFENRDALFPGVHRSYKFSLLTLRGKFGQLTPSQSSPSPTEVPSPLMRDGQDEGEIYRDKGEISPSQFAFFLTRTEQLKDQHRVFNLTPQDFKLLNPNTQTCPIFRTREDAELTKKIYQRVPVIINEKTGANPWGIKFLLMFMMNTDSHLFKTRTELEAIGFHLFGNRMVKGEEVYLPLYEAKMIWQFDHRFGTYAGVESRRSTHLPTPTEKQYQDPNFVAIPWYWVSNKEINFKLNSYKNQYLLGLRSIARSTDERTFISSIIPMNGVSGKYTLVFINNTKKFPICVYHCNLNSLIFDYFVRQKIGGTDISFHYIKQLPILPPEFYTPSNIQFIVPRVLELTYTAWDIKAFADDVWRDAEENLRGIIREQWEENKRLTGGHEWEPPEWAEIEENGIPLPPFKWSEERRAVLRAELDAYYAKLYGLTEKELRYILDPQDVYGPEFPGETFRVLKEKEIRRYGEYRTRRLVLEAWELLKQ